MYRVAVCGERGAGKTAVRRRAFLPLVQPRDYWRRDDEPDAAEETLLGVRIAVAEHHGALTCLDSVDAVVLVLDATRPPELAAVRALAQLVRETGRDVRLHVLLHKADAADADGLRGLEAGARKAALPTLAHVAPTSIYGGSVLRPWHHVASAAIGAHAPGLRDAVAGLADRVYTGRPPPGESPAPARARMFGAEALLLDARTLLPVAHAARGRMPGPEGAGHRAEALALVLRAWAAGVRGALPAEAVLVAEPRVVLVVRGRPGALVVVAMHARDSERVPLESHAARLLAEIDATPWPSDCVESVST